MILWEFYIKDNINAIEEILNHPDVLFVHIIPVDCSITSRYDANIISALGDDMCSTMTIKCQAYIPKLEQKFKEDLQRMYEKVYYKNFIYTFDKIFNINNLKNLIKNKPVHLTYTCV